MSEILMVLRTTPGGYLAWTMKNSALHQRLPDGTELVDRKEVDEAQSQLAALREELATAENACAITVEECRKLVYGLADAERRNSELEAVIVDACTISGQHHPSWSISTQMANIHQKLDAALNPNPEAASHDD